jgi:hypothetical protein
MVLDLFRAIFTAGMPVGVATYLLVWWSLRHGYIRSAGSVRDMEQGFKRLAREKSAARKDQKRRAKGKPARHQAMDAVSPIRDPAARVAGMTPLHGKWLAFGGGFYGVVGLLTYGVVELRELRDFFLGFESLPALFAQFGFDMLVQIFIDAARNFVVAIAWPVYWLSDIRSEHVWIWFVVAYVAYWAGARLALKRYEGGRADRSDLP